MHSIHKRNWAYLCSLSVTILFVYLLIAPYFSNKDLHLKLQQQAFPDNDIETNKTNAYVTFLCDDVMAEASEVLVYSLRQTKTQHDIAVLVLDEVSQESRDRLEYLGAKIINVNHIKYPWVSAKATQKGFNKACRYSKLNLWNLTQYKKIVFLDADTMVIQNMDELFDYPQFSAVVDIGGVLNTGVFVAEPKKETYTDILNTYMNAPSYNRGDQGFLNYYFNQTAHALPGNYNLMVKFTHFSTLVRSFVIENKAKVLHFTSETKPWNFHFLHQAEWRENYDGYLLGLWAKALRHMNEELVVAGLLNKSAEWENRDRVEYVCESQLKSNYGRNYQNKKQLTVILDLSQTTSAYSFERLLRMYASSSKVERIFIRSNNNQQIKLNNSYLRKLSIKKPVKIITDDLFHSVNNKFNPIQGIITDAVLLVDDQILPSVKELEFAFDVWNKNKDSIVGYHPYSHRAISKNQYQFVDSFNDANQYSMISSKMMLMKSDFLHAYSCLLPSSIHRLVDQHPDCLDVAINMLASGMTGAAPILIDSPSLNWSKSSSVSGSTSNCIQALSHFFDGKNTLILSNQIIKKIA